MYGYGDAEPQQIYSDTVELIEVADSSCFLSHLPGLDTQITSGTNADAS